MTFKDCDAINSFVSLVFTIYFLYRWIVWCTYTPKDPCREVIEYCEDQRWEDVRRCIRKQPDLLWTAKKYADETLARYFCCSDNLEMLQFTVQIIHEQPPEMWSSLLEKALESQCPRHFYVYCVAMDSSLECLKFLVRHCPSGAKILEKRNLYEGCNALDYACRGTHTIKTVEYILRTAPSGIGLLRVRFPNKIWQPLQYGSREIREYFTPQKIRQIGLENEIVEVYNNQQLFGQNSLVSLMMGVIIRETELLL